MSTVKKPKPKFGWSEAVKKELEKPDLDLSPWIPTPEEIAPRDVHDRFEDRSITVWTNDNYIRNDDSIYGRRSQTDGQADFMRWYQDTRMGRYPYPIPKNPNSMSDAEVKAFQDHTARWLQDALADALAHKDFPTQLAPRLVTRPADPNRVPDAHCAFDIAPQEIERVKKPKKTGTVEEFDDGLLIWWDGAVVPEWIDRARQDPENRAPRCDHPPLPTKVVVEPVQYTQSVTVAKIKGGSTNSGEKENVANH